MSTGFVRAFCLALVAVGTFVVLTGCRSGGGSATEVSYSVSLTEPSGSCSVASLTVAVHNFSSSPIVLKPHPKIHLGGRTFTFGSEAWCSPDVSPGDGDVVVVPPESPKNTPPAPVTVYPGRSFQYDTGYWVPTSLCGKHGRLTDTGIGAIPVTLTCRAS